MKKILLLVMVAAFGVYFAWRIAQVDRADSDSGIAAWLEPDSAAAIEHRTDADFRLSIDSVRNALREAFPELTDAHIDTMIQCRYIETRMVNGTLMAHNKAIRNAKLLDPAINGGARYRGDHASAARIAYADSVIQYTRGKNPLGGAHRVTYRFSVDIPYHAQVAGDSLRVWMPLAMESDRQDNIVIHSSEPADYVLSTPETSVHHTVCYTIPAPAAPGDTAHLEYTASFDTRGKYVSPEYLLANIKPYDKTSADYIRYTAPEGPHIIRMDSLAHAIVGDETNPWRQSEMVYDYIIRTYPWAGAREYSTIPCIPRYVVTEGHGDCGQVSLLYISLMRSLGVPARWESGWMLHPGEKNLHDWAQVYFEGIGWIPVDVSFGRYTTSDDPAVVNFYSTGIDAHRLASNSGVCGDLYPPKKYVRSETVDFQLGEVEALNHGNMFYPAWNSHLQLIEIKPIP